MPSRCTFGDDNKYDNLYQCEVRTENAELKLFPHKCESVSNQPYSNTTRTVCTGDDKYMLQCKAGYTMKKNGSSYNTCEKKNI
jgi:hypothetical protein